MTRREDWPERLLETIERHGALPFQWGVSDCLTFPMDCVLAMTGHDPSAGQRNYTTAAGAKKRLRQHGFETVADAFAAHFEEIPPSMAGRGDLGVIEGPHGCSGVVFLDTRVVGKAEGQGNRLVPRSLATRAFKVV